LPYALHVCGKTDCILGNLAELEADGLELDQRTDIYRAREAMGSGKVFIGNLDPSAVLCLGSRTLVEEKTRELLDVFRATPRLILNAGCAIPAATPSDNLRAMIRAARECPIGPSGSNPMSDPPALPGRQ
jgi:[methyl-Co(III) methanol-specific corrinoid protein]:coenzyme M methyltransferase